VSRPIPLWAKTPRLITPSREKQTASSPGDFRRHNVRSNTRHYTQLWRLDGATKVVVHYQLHNCVVSFTLIDTLNTSLIKNLYLRRHRYLKSVYRPYLKKKKKKKKALNLDSLAPQLCENSCTHTKNIKYSVSAVPSLKQTGTLIKIFRFLKVGEKYNFLVFWPCEARIPVRIVVEITFSTFKLRENWVEVTKEKEKKGTFDTQST